MTNKTLPYQREACVTTFNQALKAWKWGADQLEVCSYLEFEGLTPDFNLVKKIVNEIPIPVKVLIRPLPGSFYCTPKHFEFIREDIDEFKLLPIQGVVFGILSEKNQLDIKRMNELAQFAFPLQSSVHKVIDQSNDILEDLQLIKQSGLFKSILTSGGSTQALGGIKMLKEMINLSSDEIQIIPAGKITNENLETIHKLLNATIYHGKSIVGKLG